MQYELLKLVAVIFSATGFWQLTTYFLNYKSEKKLKAAAAQTAQAQAESELIGNWINWSRKLEERVKELEEVGRQNIVLQARIEELETTVGRLQSENQGLKAQVARLLNDGTNGQ